MRWMWLDRFVEFIRGERSIAIKNVSLTEEPLSDYLPGFPVLPCSLIVEGLAWTGGILANEHRGFRERMVLAKVNRPCSTARPCQVTNSAIPPCSKRSKRKAHSSAERATSGRVTGEVDLFLAHLPERFEASKAIWSIPPRRWP